MGPGGHGADDLPPPRRRGPTPALVWLMLGVVLVLAFVIVLVMVFDAPPSWKAQSLGPAQRSPAPPQQVAPATPTPNPPPTQVHKTP